MRSPRKTAVAAVVAWGIWATCASADVIFTGPASDGSIRTLSPGDAPAESAVSPQDLEQAEILSPGQAPESYEALRPGATQTQAISPGDHPALPALSPGESRSQAIYNPRNLVGEPGDRQAMPVMTEGPATAGSVRETAREASYTTEVSAVPAASSPGGWVDASSSYGRSAASGESGSDVVWSSKRVVPAMMVKGWGCASREHVKVAGETLEICNGIWLQPLMWAGGTSYVPVYPPVGAELLELSPEPATVTAGGKPYLVVAATFYEKVARDGTTRYRVVRAPIGAVLGSIPRLAIDRGAGVFQYDSVFFRKTGESYTVIPEPS